MANIGDSGGCGDGNSGRLGSLAVAAAVERSSVALAFSPSQRSAVTSTSRRSRKTRPKRPTNISLRCGWVSGQRVVVANCPARLQHALAKNTPKMHAPIDTVVGRRVVSLSSCKKRAAIKIRYASRFRAARAARSAGSVSDAQCAAQSFPPWPSNRPNAEK